MGIETSETGWKLKILIALQASLGASFFFVVRRDRCCLSCRQIPDWAAKVFGKELRAAKSNEKAGRGR